MLKQLGKFLGGGVAKPIRDISGAFIAPRDERAQMRHSYEMAVLQNFNEYMSSEPTSIFGKFIKACNQIPRPALALGSIGLIAYAFVDPVNFGAAMTSLALVPAELWAVLGGVQTFYLYGRLQTKKLDNESQLRRLENLEKTTELVLRTRERMLEQRYSDKVTSDSA